MRARSLAIAGVLLGGCRAEPPTPEQFLAMAARGQTAKVVTAIRSGVELNARDRNGFSALSTAAANGHLETVRALVERGAAIDQGPGAYRPLVQAAYGGHLEIVEYLIKEGAEVEYGYREEQPIAMTFDPAILRLLVRAGTQVDRPSGLNYETSLHRAAARGEIEAAKVLLELGANVQAQTITGSTPLHFACRAQGIELRVNGAARARQMLQILLAAHADPNIRDQNLNIPLHFAARNEWLRPEDLESLVNAGRRKNLKNAFGRTPLDVARANGFQKDRLRLAVLTPGPGKE